MFQDKKKAEEVLEDHQHPNMKFTMEKEAKNLS